MMATSGAAAAYSAAMNAIKAMGPIIQVEENDFRQMLHKMDNPLVLFNSQKIIKTTYRYLINYKGFFFFTKSKQPIDLGNAEIVNAKTLMIPLA